MEKSRALAITLSQSDLNRGSRFLNVEDIRLAHFSLVLSIQDIRAADIILYYNSVEDCKVLKSRY